MLAPLFTGFTAGLALIVAIGAQNSFVLRQGLHREHLLPITLTCAASDALLIAAGVAGLGALIESHPGVLALARYAGAAFLLGYGGRAARRAWHGEALGIERSAPASGNHALATCLALTFLNPHVYLDTLVLLGALANQHGSSGRWLFGAGAASASFVWFFALAFGARLLTPLFRKPLAWRVLDSLVALIMGGLGIGLLLGEGAIGG